jgi:hypothetical protein
MLWRDTYATCVADWSTAAVPHTTAHMYSMRGARSVLRLGTSLLPCRDRCFNEWSKTWSGIDEGWCIDEGGCTDVGWGIDAGRCIDVGWSIGGGWCIKVGWSIGAVNVYYGWEDSVASVIARMHDADCGWRLPHNIKRMPRELAPGGVCPGQWLQAGPDSRGGEGRISLRSLFCHRGSHSESDPAVTIWFCRSKNFPAIRIDAQSITFVIGHSSNRIATASLGAERDEIHGQNRRRILRRRSSGSATGISRRVDARASSTLSYRRRGGLPASGPSMVCNFGRVFRQLRAARNCLVRG